MSAADEVDEAIDLAARMAYASGAAHAYRAAAEFMREAPSRTSRASLARAFERCADAMTEAVARTEAELGDEAATS